MSRDSHSPEVPVPPAAVEVWEDDTPQPTYQVLYPPAVISLVLGGLSILTFLSWYLAVLPVAGILLGLQALREIKHAPLELTGKRLALAGLGLSVGLWIVGGTALVMIHTSEVPIGYTETSFPSLQPNRDAGEILPAKAIDLNDKRVYLTGFMYPGRQSIRIKEFLLVPTQGHCKFCQTSIVPTEMVRVKFTGDVLADYSTNRVGVGGKLHVDQSPGFQEGEGCPYTLEADYFQNCQE